MVFGDCPSWEMWTAVIVCRRVVNISFKQKTAYEMRISDWSQTCALPICFAAITVERPVGPDAHALCDQRTDVGVAGQEPQQFTQRRLPINALGGQQRDRKIGRAHV